MSGFLSTLLDKAYFEAAQVGEIYYEDQLIYKSELKLANLSAGFSGGPGVTSGNQAATSSGSWNISGFNTLTYSASVGGDVAWWASPYGSQYSRSRSICLVLKDGKEIGLAAGTNKTLDLSAYTDEQKSSVRFRYKFGWNISSVTNSYFSGTSGSIYDAVAS